MTIHFPTKAVILAAGSGSRLRPLIGADNLHKPTLWRQRIGWRNNRNGWLRDQQCRNKPFNPPAIAEPSLTRGFTPIFQLRAACDAMSA